MVESGPRIPDSALVLAEWPLFLARIPLGNPAPVPGVAARNTRQRRDTPPRPAGGRREASRVFLTSFREHLIGRFSHLPTCTDISHPTSRLGSPGLGNPFFVGLFQRVKEEICQVSALPRIQPGTLFFEFVECNCHSCSPPR